MAEDGIPISEETLERFKNEHFNTAEYAGADGHYEDIPTNQEATQQLNEAAGWLLKTIDTALRDKDDRLGTDPKTIERVSELSVLVAKRNVSEDILRNSPELFLGTIIAGLAIEKSIVFKKIKKEVSQGNGENSTDKNTDNEQ